jgi:hypothetical protein
MFCMRNATLALGCARGVVMLSSMCGRVRLSSDVSEIKLVFSIPPERPTPNFALSWNAAPSDQFPIVRFDAKGRRAQPGLRALGPTAVLPALPA